MDWGQAARRFLLNPQILRDVGMQELGEAGELAGGGLLRRSG